MKDLWRGIARHPWKTVRYAFVAFSVITTIMQGTTYLVPGVKIEGSIPLGIVIVISIAYAIKRIWKPSSIEINVSNSNTVIKVVFGDLFEQEGIRAIAVSEFFESKIGLPVSDKSLHGVFLQKCFGGHPESFDKAVDEQLKNVEGTECAKIDGKTKKFPIGSTVLISVNKDRYLLFAFTKTDPQTCKTYSNVTMLWDSLSSLWQRARIESGGHTLNLPLVGSGLSGLGLPTRDLLNLIILSTITETKAKPITQIIRIVLSKDRFEDIDLRDFQNQWEAK